MALLQHCATHYLIQSACLFLITCVGMFHNGGRRSTENLLAASFWLSADGCKISVAAKGTLASPPCLSTPPVAGIVVIDLHDFGHLILNRMIVISFELEKVEFRMFIPVIPLPEKSQKEFRSKICT